jgi:hypothetical protein
MKRSQWGLSDIERRQEDEARRFRNAVRALLIVALVSGLVNYVTQINGF